MVSVERRDVSSEYLLGKYFILDSRILFCAGSPASNILLGLALLRI
jgi:hypothetical protein